MKAGAAIFVPLRTVAWFARGFQAANGALLAAAIAYFGTLSLIPLALLGLSVAGRALGPGAARESIHRLIREVFPVQADGLTSAIDELHASSDLLGVAGLLSLFITGLGVFSTLEAAVNSMWGLPPRSFVRGRLMALLAFAWVVLLLFTSAALSGLLGWARHIPPLAWIADSAPVQWAAGITSPLLACLTFSFLFHTLPSTAVRTRPALTAGVLTGVTWEFCKRLWILQSAFVDRWPTYGAVSGFAGLLLWIYLTGLVTLLGARLTCVLQTRPDRSMQSPE